MQDFDIRWKQRFDNYNKALTKLKEAVSIISRELHYGSEVDELLQEGLIQRFEYTHELVHYEEREGRRKGRRKGRRTSRRYGKRHGEGACQG